MVVVLAGEIRHSDCLYDSCYLGYVCGKEIRFSLSNSFDPKFQISRLYLFEHKLMLSTNVLASFKLLKLVVG